MHPKQLSISDYTYQLPEHSIANYPLPVRDASKLLVYDNGIIRDDNYKNITSYIAPGSMLIFNNTKVVEARLLFQKPTGGTVEIFCLEPHEQYADISSAMSEKGKVWWQCLVGGASKWKHGQVLKKIITAYGKEIILQAVYVEKRMGSFVIELSWSDPEMSFAELLHHAGAIPLPPYIKRKAESSDAERYQTIYASLDGSVAAPTAGLHFTDELFGEFAKKNIQRKFVTLHVGAGTFKPVKSETMEQHEMHAEYIDVSKETINDILTNLDNRIIAVGTTSLRTIESLYWLGVKLNIEKNQSIPELQQWDPYDLPVQDLTAHQALENLRTWMESNSLEKLVTKTKIIIAPGYTPKIADGLITNFHQPQSTLLLLVAALVGDDWKRIYEHALQNDYRFLSYGDGCFLNFRK